jgi:hypothetical protein
MFNCFPVSIIETQSNKAFEPACRQAWQENVEVSALHYTDSTPAVKRMK